MPQLPDGQEQRLVHRILRYWRDLRGDRDFPVLAEVDPSAISDLWPHCFVLELAGHKDDPVFRSIGSAHASDAAIPLENCRMSDAPFGSLVDASTALVQEVIAKKVPITRGGEFVAPSGSKVLYRSIIMPFSEDGETVDALLGAANSREVVGSTESRRSNLETENLENAP